MKNIPAEIATQTAQGAAFLFPGQGVQYFQMGAELFRNDPVFRDILLRLDGALVADGNQSVLERLYAENIGRDALCEDLCFTHPALLMVELGLALRLQAGGTRPDICLAVSLGEFAAAAFAGVLPPEEMLCCIAKTARIIQNGCAAGRMMTVLGPISAADGLIGVEFVGEQADNQFIIAGPEDAIDAAGRKLRADGHLVVTPPIARAFHTSAMDAVAADVAAVFANRHYRPPKVPLISAMTGSIIAAPDAAHFARVGRGQINFRMAVQTLESLALESLGKVFRLIDVGPSGSLSTLAARLLRAAQEWPQERILSPFAAGQSELDRLKALDEVSMKNLEQIPSSQRDGRWGKAVVFAGQGSQVTGMGEEHFSRLPDLVASADRILGYSIADVCRENPSGKLGNTRYAQPLIFCVNALAWQHHVANHGMPDVLAGHSLGEMNALHAAGVMDFETALGIVKKRAELMAEAPAGAMSAVLGLDRARLEQIIDNAGFDQVDIANLNTPGQIVISGDADQIRAAAAIIQAEGAKACIPLPVSGAFHSRLMRKAEAAFAEYLSSFRFAPPLVPVVSNVTARPYSAMSIGGQIAGLLSRSVDWVGSVGHMLDMGVRDFVELAPKPVLTQMIAEIRRTHVAAMPGPLVVPSLAPEIAILAPSAVPIVQKTGSGLGAETLGSAAFRAVHGVRYSHICGGMVHGIASVDWVVACANAGILSFFGTGGLSSERVESALADLTARIPQRQPFGVNLLSGSNEAANVALFLRYGIRTIEASAFIKMTPELVRYRLLGLSRDALSPGGVAIGNRVVAKLSRPEVARIFLLPAPDQIVQSLLAKGDITSEMAELAKRIPMADDICVEADSGGHTDQGNATVLIPAVCRLRDAVQAEMGYARPVRIGAGGGIGTPDAAASALVLGAEFTVTGSINQCTQEAGTSTLVKQMLAEAEVQDTAYAPAGDMFEIGAQVQVLRRGVLFPARANRLFDLYMHHDGIEDIDYQTRDQVETRYFQRGFDQVWQDCLAYWPPEAIERALSVPKQKMAYIFRWYFGLSGRLALQGTAERKVDFQIHCGPAMGAFNQWVAGTSLADWQNRTVVAVNSQLLTATADRIERAIRDFSRT
ncbi:ACP S-malonyltransferase (plasmid) [Agrobacterium vitis]|uniref:ACP S-malonyltransferase n=1 Tax=Agrobacterium vitis TaxID=373 RepID=UPI003D272217